MKGKTMTAKKSIRVSAELHDMVYGLAEKIGKSTGKDVDELVERVVRNGVGRLKTLVAFNANAKAKAKAEGKPAAKAKPPGKIKNKPKAAKKVAPKAAAKPKKAAKAAKAAAARLKAAAKKAVTKKAAPKTNGKAAVANPAAAEKVKGTPQKTKVTKTAKKPVPRLRPQKAQKSA